MNLQLNCEDAIFEIKQVQDLPIIYTMNDVSDIACHDIVFREKEKDGYAFDITGTDPFVIFPQLAFSKDRMHLLHISGNAPDNQWQIYYLSDDTSIHSEDRRMNIDMNLYQKSDAIVILDEGVTGNNLRIDFGGSTGNAVIREISFYELPVIPASSIYDKFHDISNNTWCKLLCESYSKQDFCGVTFPGFPKEEIQFNMVGASGISALSEISKFYIEVQNSISRLKNPITTKTKLVDFGCGYGRLTRFFLKDINAKNLVGVDTVNEFIDICRKTFSAVDIPKENFIHNNSFPPLPLDDQSVDIVTAYSVFTHLSEKATKLWLGEFHRILRKNGLLIFTVRQKGFLEIWKNIRDESTLSPYANAQYKIWGDYRNMMNKYNKGEYMFNPTGGGHSLDSSFYGDAVIPETYIEKVFSDKYSIEIHFEDMGKFFGQAFYVLSSR